MVRELLLAVDIQLEVSGAFHVDNILASLLRDEGGLVLGGEVFDGQVGCKDMHTGGGHVHGFGVVFGREGLALHLSVIPESAFQTLLAVGSHTLRGEMALHDLVVGQVATR